MTKKNITILTTGGTIAGKGTQANQAKYLSAQISALDLIKTAPDIDQLANITCEQALSIASQDINDKNWLAITKRVNELLSGDADGVVITHGTDTLEETAYFLNLTIKSTKPVILVGAMRPTTSLSADGPINLYNAVALACNPQSQNIGVLVVMADNIFAARDVSKVNTSGIEAFASSNSGKIGHISYGDSQIYYQPHRLHTTNAEFDVTELELLPKVDIVYVNAGFDPNIIDCLAHLNSQAIVIAGVGSGNICQSAVEKLIAIRKKGIFVFKSSRVGSGFILPNIEVEDHKYGFITTDNLSPQKARVLAKLALCQTKDLEQITNIFAKY
jgi:L-asparaginase